MKVSKITFHTTESEPIDWVLPKDHTQIIGSGIVNHRTVIINGLEETVHIDELVYFISVPSARIADEIKHAIEMAMLKYK